MEKRVSEDEMTVCITDAMDTNVGKPQEMVRSEEHTSELQSPS